MKEKDSPKSFGPNAAVPNVNPRIKYVQMPEDKKPTDFWIKEHEDLMINSFCKHHSLKYSR